MAVYLAQVFIAVAMLMALYAIRSFYLEFKNQFTENARVSMEDLFLFIDPAAIIRLNLALLLLLPSFVWFLTGAWPLALLVALLTAAMPRIAYVALKARRLQRINEQMPDALAMLASALRAGSSLQMGLTLLVNESPAPISQEFSMVLRAQRLGMALEDALEGLGKRLNIEDMDLFVSAMVIAKEVGGNLAEILERLSQTLRTKASMEGKINALTAQGKMQGWVVGLLPLALGAVLYTMDPEAMSPLFTTVYGWAVMGVILIFLLLGGFFIRKIVTIDI